MELTGGINIIKQLLDTNKSQEQSSSLSQKLVSLFSSNPSLRDKEKDRFNEVMSEFLKISEPKVTALQRKLEETKKLLTEVRYRPKLTTNPACKVKPNQPLGTELFWRNSYTRM
jgi:hypothetical protein